MKKIIHNLKHKISHINIGHFKNIMKKYGLPFLIIFIIWEVVEDIIFPIIFYYLGMNYNSFFLGLIPVSWILCLHPIAVPIIWWLYCFVFRKEYEKPDIH
jgi:hypothetical protein